MNKLKYHILFLLLIILTSCGAASAPVTPMQIPTTVSLAADSYGDGFVMSLAESVAGTASVSKGGVFKSVAGTADADCTGCSVVFTNSATGAVDTTGACGTSLISGPNITLTGGNDWPNLESQCSLQIFDSNNNPLSLSVVAPSTSESPSLAKSQSIYKASGSTSLTAFYDTSLDVINTAFSIVTNENILTSVGNLDMTKVGTTIYTCYVDLNEALENDSIVFATSEDDGDTFVVQSVLRSSSSLINSDGCAIEALEMADGSILIGVILMGTEKSCEGEDCQVSAQAIVSTDGGATFGSVFEVADGVGSAERSSFPFAISDTGIMFGLHATSSPSQARVIAFNSEGILSTVTFGIDTVGGISRSILASGSDVYAIYGDHRYETESIYNLVATAFTYNNSVFTEGNTYRISTSSDCTSNISAMGASLDREGRVLVFWSNPDDFNGILSVVDPSLDSSDSSAVTSYTIDTGITTVAVPYTSYSNHLNLFYLKDGDGGFKLGEFTSEGLDMTDNQPINLSETLVNLKSSVVFSGPDGRFYYLYSLTTGNMSMMKLVLTGEAL